MQIAEARQGYAREYNTHGSQSRSLKHLTPNERWNQQEREGSSTNLDLPHSLSEKLVRYWDYSNLIYFYLNFPYFPFLLKKGPVMPSILFGLGMPEAIFCCCFDVVVEK